MTALEYDAPTADALRDIADRLAAAEGLHRALDRQQITVKAANADALAAQAGNDAAQATPTDASEAKCLEAQGRKLAATVAETLADLDRAQRIEAAIRGQLNVAETAIRDDAEHACRMVTAWAHQVAIFASAEIRAAFAPPAPRAVARSLREALTRAHVLQRGSQSRGLLDALDAVRIPDPVNHSASIAARVRYCLADGEAIKFMAGWPMTRSYPLCVTSPPPPAWRT